MCEYCGCQDIASIGELTREHDAAVNLIGDIRAAEQRGDTASMADTARRIAEILRPHTQVEEYGLFPAMVDEFAEQIADLEAEHRFIETVLDEALDGTPSDPQWPSRLTEALAVLREHILKEQDGVFPAALAHLSTEQWEVIDAVRAEAGSALVPPAARAGS